MEALLFIWRRLTQPDLFGFIPIPGKGIDGRVRRTGEWNLVNLADVKMGKRNGRLENRKNNRKYLRLKLRLQFNG